MRVCHRILRVAAITCLATAASLTAIAQEFRGPPGGGGFPGGGFPGGGAPGGGFPGGGFPGGPGGGDFRGRGERFGGGDFRGGGGDFRGGRGGFDPRGMLTQFDANGNGQIEPSEMQGRGEFVRRMAERAGLDPNQPVSIDRLSSSFAQMRQGQGEDRNRDDRDRDDRNRDDRNRDERDRDDRSRSSSSTTSAPPRPPARKASVPRAASRPASPDLTRRSLPVCQPFPLKSGSTRVSSNMSRNGCWTIGT